MHNAIFLLEGSELQKQFEPIFEMKEEVAALKKAVTQKPSSKYYTISEVCSLLHISRSTIYRMMKNGDLKAKKAYRRVLFLEKDINELLIPINQ